MALEALVSSIVWELAASIAQPIQGSFAAAWGLKDELEKLQTLLATIRDVLADAEEKRSQEGVRMWLDALKKTAYEAEDVVDQFNYEILRHKAAAMEAAAGKNGNNKVSGKKVRDFFSSHNQILFRVKMGWKLTNILKRIKEIESAGKAFRFAVNNNEQRKTNTPNSEETSSFVVESDVVGRNEARDMMVTMLINNNSENLAVLPIVGLGGLGKTTMAQLIYSDPRVVNHFQMRGWVYVSEDWDMIKIIERAVSSIVVEQVPEQSTLELKQRRLREALNGKRFLIVLDDIWKEDRDEWEKLRGILDCGGKEGSAVIVTTRSNRVAEITVRTLQSHDLSYLSEDESWDLFSSKAFAPGDERPEELVEIGKAIVRKCEGLPLAVKMLGSSLYKRTDRNDWLAIRESSLWNMENDKILPALRLSYKHLPSYSKRCFAFCALLPKGKPIEKEALIQMWMAHGFIPSSKRLYVEGQKTFMQLVQRSFLQDLKPETRRNWFGRPGQVDEHQIFTLEVCSMHDLVRDLAQSIVGNECISLSKESPEISESEDTYHLSGLLDRYSGKWRDFPLLRKMKPSLNLRTLINYSLTEKDTNIFTQYSSLRVLQLKAGVRHGLPTKVWKHLRFLELKDVGISNLPESICTLLHLQTLNLPRCEELYKLPENIYKLLNLQVLNLDGCTRLCKLPERMPCMSALRILNLDRCNSLCKMPAGMGRMTSLETLTVYVVSNENGRGIEELEGLRLSTKLELYNLRCVEDVGKAKQVNLHSKDLHMLTLCWRAAGPVLASMYNEAATNLNQENGAEVLEALKPPGGIKMLKIWDCHGLKFPAWMMGCIHLVELNLEYCTRFDQLPPLWRLNSLEVLSLNHLDNLKYIISDDDDAAGDTSTVPVFPSLKKLRLRSLRSLEVWWKNKNADEAMSNCFPSLATLEIEECPELTGSRPLLSCLEFLTLSESKKIRLGSFRHLRRLEVLYLTECDEGALTWRDLEEEEMTVFGSCLRDMTLKDCDWMFSSRRSGLWRCMTSLRCLEIWYVKCQALGNLFEVLRGLNSLRELGIRKVSETTMSDMDASLPPQLEMFRFSSCESLMTLTLRCPASLKDLRILDCPNLVSLTTVEQVPGQVTSLKKIILSGCCKLNSLELGEGGLTYLDDLFISQCSELTSLPACLLQGLPNLNELHIVECPELGKKCTRGGEYWHLVSNIPKRDIYIRANNFHAKLSNFLCGR